MKIEKVIVSEYKTNCYVLSIEGQALVIDPGDEYDKIASKLKNKHVLGAVITHSHPDHIGASSHFETLYDYNNLKEGKNKIGPFEFEVIYTPGHRFDSITLYFENEKIMFTGDFLFYGTIGRTDLEGSDPDQMKKSIEKIKNYPDCKVLPGHGWATTLQREKEKNIYYRSLYE